MQIRTLLAGLFAGTLAAGTSAAVISPTGVDDSAADSFNNASFVASNLIGAAHVAALGDAPAETNNWVSNARGADFFAADPTAGSSVLVFDMGADTDLGAVYIWAYSNGTGVAGLTQNNSLADFSLAFATDAEGTGAFGTSIALNPTFVAANTLPNNGAGGGVDQPVQTFGFGQVVNARYVQVTLLDNYAGAAGGAGGDRVGFNEIAFDTTNVPEPGSLALLGLGGLATLRRRRA